MSTRTRNVGLVALLVAALGLAALLAVWSAGTLGPSDEALAMLQADGEARFWQDRNYIAFGPLFPPPEVGFVLYPGGRVDHRAYAPVLHEIASQGYLAVALRSPLNLAFFDSQGADHAIDAFGRVQNWVVGGHSLGGVVAAGYAAGHPDIAGLALWAAYPADARLQSADLRVVSIYGSNDALSTPEEVLQSRSLLPSGARFVEIVGGNHAQFGAYGPQPGDAQADISAEAQWARVAAVMVELLDSIAEQAGP